MNIFLRPASLKDITLLQKLDYEVFVDNQKYDDNLILDWALSEKGKKYFQKFLANKNSLCFIAEEKGKPVGYVACQPKIISYRKDKILEIENMGVIPAFRSQGIGTMLLDFVKKEAKKRNYQRLFVNAYFKNIKALSFYKRNGLGEIDISLEMKI